jgi:hypothetical protein
VMIDMPRMTVNMTMTGERPFGSTCVNSMRKCPSPTA